MHNRNSHRLTEPRNQRFTPEQDRSLDLLSTITGTPRQALVRQAVAEHLLKHEPMIEAAEKRKSAQ